MPDHFSGVFGVHAKAVGVAFDVERRFLRVGELRIVQVPQFVHTSQHIQLTQLGAFGVDHRVKARRGFGQPGEHRRLGRADVLQVFAKVDLRRRCKAVSPLAKINLVDVDLQNLVLGKAGLDFEREHGLVGFARDGFFAGEEKVPRHLHRYGRSSLAFPPANQIGVRGPQNPQRIDPRVLVKAFIFSG